MNKKLFIGATVVTAVAVAGVVYYRHVLAEEWKKLQGEERPQGDESEMEDMRDG